MIRWYGLVALLLQTMLGFSQTWKTESGKVTFLSEAKFNSFSGTSDQLQGLIDLEKNLVDFYVDLNTLKTGIGLRDRHMRDNYLETKKFPYAEFTGSFAEIPNLPTGQPVRVEVSGKFKVHGVVQSRTFSGILKKENSGELLLEATFEVKLEDHKIEVPKVLAYELATQESITLVAVLKSVQP